MISNVRSWAFCVGLILSLLAPNTQAENVAATTPGVWSLYKGSSKTTDHASEQACVTASMALPAGTYSCRTITKVVTTVKPPPPKPTTGFSQTVACAAPTTGTWTQTRDYTLVDNTWQPTAWMPATAPAGACVTPPPPKPTTGFSQTVACVAPAIGSWTQTRDYTLVANVWQPTAWAPTSPPADACVVPPPPPPAVDYVKCADEGGVCKVTVDSFVVYGAGTQFSAAQSFSAGTSVVCRNSTFGDPAPGMVKVCMSKPSNGATVPPVVTPPVVTPPVITPPVVTPPPVAANSAVLSWLPPEARFDGTPLTNLAGFVIAYGSSPQTYTARVTIADPAATTATITGLASGKTWYFAVAVVDANGVEGPYSLEVSKVMQ